MTRPAACAAIAAFLLVAPPRGPARANADVDVSSLLARIDARLADAETPRKARSAYTALRRKLASTDRAGLVDDFGKLRAVAVAVRKPLATDAPLANLLGAAFEAAAAAVDDAVVGLAVDALDVADAGARQAADGAVHRTREFVGAARLESLRGREVRACTKGRAAAAALRTGEKALARALKRQDARTPRWSVVLSGRDAALLAVHVAADGPSPVYVVGAEDAQGPTFLRGGAEGFARIAVGGSGDLWWVDEIPGAGVWAVGSHGRVIVYDPATGTIDERPIVSENGALYGVWGASATDVWAVGHDPDSTGELSAAFHWDGVAWSEVALPPAAAGLDLFKVWGTAAADVWACGAGGTLLHYDGVEWSIVPSGTSSDLITLHGVAPRVAVGRGPTLLERATDGSWVNATLPEGTRPLNGVRVGDDGAAWAAGFGGTLLRRTQRGWIQDAEVPATNPSDFHAVEIDAAGGVWVAGGNLTSLQGGVLLHRGTRTYGSAVADGAGLGSAVFQAFTRDDSCGQTACHAQPFLSEKLDVATREGLRERLVGVPSRQSAYPLVAPGRPSASYLFRKVEGTHAAAGGIGDRMPVGEDPWTPEEIDALRAWILEGAPDSP